MTDNTLHTNFPEADRNWLSRHRGPFRLQVIRPDKKKGFSTSEWLKGEVTADTAEEEMEAILTDPRDNVSYINVWSVRDEQFIWTKRRGEDKEDRG